LCLLLWHVLICPAWCRSSQLMVSFLFASCPLDLEPYSSKFRQLYLAPALGSSL
jgi:hypothetical protein